jgi:hypothetical protein
MIKADKCEGVPRVMAFVLMAVYALGIFSGAITMYLLI